VDGLAVVGGVAIVAGVVVGARVGAGIGVCGGAEVFGQAHFQAGVARVAVAVVDVQLVGLGARLRPVYVDADAAGGVGCCAAVLGAESVGEAGALGQAA